MDMDTSADASGQKQNSTSPSQLSASGAPSASTAASNAASQMSFRRWVFPLVWASCLRCRVREQKVEGEG